MRLWVSIERREIPDGQDPILELIPILRDQGFVLCGNGVSDVLGRFLTFEFPVSEDDR